MARRENQGHSMAICSNLIATVVLAALLLLALHLNFNKFIIGNIATDGYRIANLDATSWNVACTLVGTAFGILVSVAFASQDDCITRRELASGRGVVAMFLRPLTLKRGVEQVLRRQLPFERTLLVILTMATALTSATIVALFSVHVVTDEILNFPASFPLADLNSTFFESGHGGAVFPIGNVLQTSQRSQLSGFLYKAAYITGLKMKGKYGPSKSPYLPYILEQGPLGDTIYGQLNTGGVGLNQSSYLQYSGRPDGFSMPAQFEFSRLQASVFGTHVKVLCQNATSEYTVVDLDESIPLVTLLLVEKPGGRNFTFFRDLQSSSSQGSLAIGSFVTIESETDEPTHTLVIPNFSSRSAFVLECTYSGHEYLADVSIASLVSPLRIDRERNHGPILGPFVKQLLANRNHFLLDGGSSSNMGGNLAQGFIDAEYNVHGDNNTHIAIALETMLGQLGEAYFSLLRQQVERSNLYKGREGTFPENGSEVRFFVKVLRLGGGNQYGWLVLLGALLVGTVVGMVRTCTGQAAAVPFEAQDTVKFLRSALHDPSVHDGARIRYDEDGIAMLREGGKEMHRLAGRVAISAGIGSERSRTAFQVTENERIRGIEEVEERMGSSRRG